MLHSTTHATPVGELVLIASDRGLRAILWPKLSSARAGIYPRPHRNTDHPILVQTAAQLDEYFAGSRTAFDIPLDLQGTRFQLAAWRSLADIPFGMTTSYGRQAAALGIPATRRTTLHALAHAVAGGTLALDPGADRSATYQQLIRLPGIGEWTAGYIVMRALGDPDTFLGSDLGIKKAGARIGLGSNPRVMSEHAAAWRPWRSYATHQLWATLSDTPKETS
jgi:O6-methylguanine-DNA--protein-cysteine methyltransferase